MTTEAELPRDEVDPDDGDELEEPPPPPITRSQKLARSLVFVTFMAVAIGGAFVGIRSRERDDAFIERQFAPRLVSKADVERTMSKTLKKTTAVSCAPGTQGGMLRNDWNCRVTYTSGRTLPLQLHFQPDGSYIASGLHNRFSGCCVPVPLASRQ